MPLSDYLKEQVGSAIERTHEKSMRELEMKSERKQMLFQGYAERAQPALQKLEKEIETASKKAEEISSMGMPDTSEDARKMIQECIIHINQPIKTSSAKVLLEDIYDADEDGDLPEVDFELPSKTIHQAWEARLQDIKTYVKVTFPNDTELATWMKAAAKTQRRAKLRTYKWVFICLAVMFGSFGFLAIMIVCTDKSKYIETMNEYVAQKEYTDAISIAEEHELDDDSYKVIIEAMIEDGLYQDAFTLAVDKNMNFSYMLPLLQNVGLLYMKTHSKKATINFIDECIPISYERYKGLTNTAKQNIGLIK